MTAIAARQPLLYRMLCDCPIVPVLTIERAEHGVPLARALVAGGITNLEVTLRTAAARDAAAAIVRDVPEAVVGIGTVLTPTDLAVAEQLGAKFAVSPGSTPDLLEAAVDGDLPFLPGAQTASEVMACLLRGFDIVKLFPAGPAGGLPLLRSLAGPFPAVRFCPTGGISETNAGQWLQEPNVIAVGGSWIAPSADIHAGNWAAITQRAARAVQMLRS